MTGVVLLFVAPWTMRLVVYLDRRMMHLLLGPDAAASRVRSLEESRSKTLDAATETLRRIERDLHDGTQAQLVALAMRLGQAKEKLEHLDRRRPRPPTSRPSAAWSTRPTAGPRRPSPTSATWPGASTRRRSTPAWKTPSLPSPHAARCLPR